MAMMGRQLEHMVRLIDDLLDVSRISRGKIELRKEHVELAAVVNLTVESVRPLRERMKHELAVTLPSTPIYLDADPTRLGQIVGNLLNNACKFTREGGRIHLTIRREGGQAVIRVQDTGIGLAAEQLARIFEMFMQVDSSRERSQGGLGIGLTLVKNLVEMHGGTVEASSEGPGRGSTFTVRLPLAPATPEGPQAGEQANELPTAVTRRRILVVDDNRDSAASLALLLQMAGHEVRTAHDGPSALEVAAAFMPEVVLLDIGLPGMSGYEMARRMRAMPPLRETLLVAQTGWGQEEDRRRSTDAGFDAHLVKPVALDALGPLLADHPKPPTERGCHC